MKFCKLTSYSKRIAGGVKSSRYVWVNPSLVDTVSQSWGEEDYTRITLVGDQTGNLQVQGTPEQVIAKLEECMCPEAEKQRAALGLISARAAADRLMGKP